MLNKNGWRQRRGGLIFLAALGLAACGRSRGPAIAQVGGESITIEDLQNRLRETPAAYQQYVASEQGRRQFVNLLVREKVVLLEARKSGLSGDPAYQKSVADFKEEWKRRVKDYEESLLVESYLRKLRSRDLAVTDAEVRQYYNDHRADYDKPVQIQASHILLNSEPDAEQALARLKKGEPFEAVARAMSKDPATASQGGKLSAFHKGMLPPEFEEAAFKLKVGEISSPVKTQFGYHIIKKTGQTLLAPRPFAAAQEEIRAQLEREKFDRWVSAKQAALGVRIDEQAIAALPAPPVSRLPGMSSQEPPQ